jgi:two-component system OmpR family response regulator/two-component system response regulator TctD
VPQVLIFVDYPPLRRVLAAILRRAGCQVALALSAHEALHALEQRGYDVLLLDMDVAPRESQYILQGLRTIRSPVPIVALQSPGGRRQQGVEYFEVGILLPKPVSREAVLTGIELALQKAIRRI